MNRFLPKSLMGRAVLTIVVPILLLQAVVTYAFFDRHWDSVTRLIVRGVAGDIAIITEGLKAVSSEAERQAIFEITARETGLVFEIQPDVQVPEMTIPSRIYVRDRIFWRELTRNLPSPIWFNSDYGDGATELRTAYGEGSIHVIIPESRITSNTADIFIFWMVGTSLIVTVIAVWFLRDQVRPIRQLAEAAENFGKGRDISDITPSGASEVRSAIQEFLNMKERIERQISQRTEMLAGVSHDLRTPLTRLKLQLAMLGPSDEIKGLERDVEDMERMVEGFLNFARHEEGEPSLVTNLKPILEEVVEFQCDLNRNISLSTKGDLTLPLKENSIKRCLVNLVSNGTTYANKVRITAERKTDSVEIIIDDDGPGIREEQREEAFRPFRRLDSSINSEQGGVGLGLAIARDSVRTHGGELSLSDSPMGGLRATIRLPA